MVRTSRGVWLCALAATLISKLAMPDRCVDTAMVFRPWHPQTEDEPDTTLPAALTLLVVVFIGISALQETQAVPLDLFDSVKERKDATQAAWTRQRRPRHRYRSAPLPIAVAGNGKVPQ
mmetsp:Transcript_32710/g.61455  ORF Transcript_32710/g.61455 Transcript_32710/m.61455 type:complete len:119 (-) Transcript_32710:305-661(-)